MAELFYERQLERLVHEMSDEVGLVQHSLRGVPNPLDHGYSVDDVARGLVVLSRVYPRFDDKGIHSTYLGYIRESQKQDGFFHNFYEYKNGKWEWRDEKPHALQDCFGRVMWALAEFSGSQYPKDERKEAEKILLGHLEVVEELEHNASKAFTLLGLSDYVLRTGNSKVMRTVRNLAENLAEKFHEHREEDEGWMWFSNKMTYCNPKLPHPMITASYALKNRDILDIGKSSLDFLISESFDERGIFHAIGNNGWYEKGREPAKYDQQTVEAGDMVEACVDAYKILGLSKKAKLNDQLFRSSSPPKKSLIRFLGPKKSSEGFFRKPLYKTESFDDYERYKDYAKKAFQWFRGRNISQKSMIDPVTGGVYDAITERGINTNQGAESILSYLLAATKLEEIE